MEQPDARADEGQIAITPDGSRLVASFVSARETGLWVRSLDQVEPLVLKGTERGGQPFWSPDGRWIGFFVEDTLKKVDRLGSSPQALTDALPRPYRNRGGTWGPSGVILFSAGTRHDGKELFYLSPKADNQFVAVDVLSKPGDAVFAAGIPRDLFVLNVVTGPVAGGRAFQRNSYQVWKDGQQLLLNSSRAVSSQDPRTTIVLNWAAAPRK